MAEAEEGSAEEEVGQESQAGSGAGAKPFGIRRELEVVRDEVSGQRREQAFWRR